MQQLSVSIDAHVPGGVNGIVVTDWRTPDQGPMVLPIPWYVALDPAAVAECFTQLGGDYWLDSYAALCGARLPQDGTLSDLVRYVMHRNIEWDAQPSLPGMGLDEESF